MTPTEQTYAYTLYGCDLRQWAPVDPDALSTWSAECEQCGWETSRTLDETGAIRQAGDHFRHGCTDEIHRIAPHPRHDTEVTCVEHRFAPRPLP